MAAPWATDFVNGVTSANTIRVSRDPREISVGIIEPGCSDAAVIPRSGIAALDLGREERVAELRLSVGQEAPVLLPGEGKAREVEGSRRTMRLGGHHDESRAPGSGQSLAQAREELDVADVRYADDPLKPISGLLIPPRDARRCTGGCRPWAARTPRA